MIPDAWSALQGILIGIVLGVFTGFVVIVVLIIFTGT